MPKTYEPIQTQTLGTAVGTVTFSSIPQTYTDLYLVTSFANTSASQGAFIRFNSDTGSNYSRIYLLGDGVGAYSGRATNQSSILIESSMYVGQTLNTSMQSRVNIMNYSNSTTNKSTISRAGSQGAVFPGTDIIVGLWRNTAAITNIDVVCTSNTFIVGSIFTLYGIKAA
jgi:hypothetical protein